MFNIKIADTVISIDNKYSYIKEMCRDYITDEEPAFSVFATDDEIMAEGTGEFPPQYLETLAVYRKIADKMPEYGGFLVHGVLMDVGGEGVLLTAESGTGKSTHAGLWMKYLGRDCEIINGDKPLVRVIDGVPYGYGTPWCGKEEINKNARVKLSCIAFVNRAAENRVEAVEKGDIIENLLPSVHIPSGNGVINTLDALDATARYASFYKIFCNMDISAAEVAYNAIIRNEKKHEK